MLDSTQSVLRLESARAVLHFQMQVCKKEIRRKCRAKLVCETTPLVCRTRPVFPVCGGEGRTSGLHGQGW